MHHSAGDNVSFLLHLVEEGEGEDGNGCRAPDAHESICQGVWAFVMVSSRSFSSREAQLLERIGNALAYTWFKRLDSSRNRPGRG